MSTRPPRVHQRPLHQTSNGSQSISGPRGQHFLQDHPEVSNKRGPAPGRAGQHSPAQAASRGKTWFPGPTLNISASSSSAGEGEGSTTDVSDGSGVATTKLSSRGKSDLRVLEGLTGTIFESPGQASFPGSGTPPSSHALAFPRSPPPMPSRPGSHAQPRRVRSSAALDSTTQKEPILKPYSLEMPLVAPQLPQNRRADFFPWTGCHPEDVLSEHAIKQGFFEKGSGLLNEHQAARATLFPVLKRQGGLQALSSSIVSVLQKKQACGRITTPSTFKPPPRVALTDKKREAWLRDLANSTIPLRRLSRTIPHGIRGRVLLEQCLIKAIPTSRAIWLAKCVGANELRAFRRKGVNGTFAMGGEAKWIKDWTVYVEQFVDSVAGLCGEEDWRVKMTYVIHLSSQLFAEQLLDQEHYLDWLLLSLEAASSDTLPVWLLIVQPYVRRIIQYRKSAMRLIGLLLDKLQKIVESEDREVLAPLVERLSDLVTSVLTQKPSCLVSTTTWSKYCDFFQVNSNPLTAELSATLRSIRSRNKALASATARPNVKDSAKTRLLRLLDHLDFDHRVDTLASQCLAIIDDKAVLIQELLMWSTSTQRKDVYGVYLAARLIKHLNLLGTDTDEVVLAFLATSSRTECCKTKVYLLVSELACSKQFSIGRYLQWLIARGALNHVQKLEEDGPCDARLLAELPLHDLPPQIINLRRTLLRSVGFSTQDEDETISKAKYVLSTLLPELRITNINLEPYINMEPEAALTWISGLSRTIKSELSRWIHREVSFHISKPKSLDDEGCQGVDFIDPHTSIITAQKFTILRTILERMQDLSGLANVIKLVLSSESAALLNSVADSLEDHSAAFDAMDALRSCFAALLERYQSLKARKILEIPLLHSLVDLANRLPRTQNVARSSGVNGAGYGTSLAAHSAVSDPITDASHVLDSNCPDNAKRLPSSGSIPLQSAASEMGSALITKLNEFARILSSNHSNKGVCHVQAISICLRFLLQLLVVYKEISRTSRASVADHARITIFLSSILLHECLLPNPSLLDHTFDVIAHFLDDLPDALRLQCIHFLKDKTSDPRIRYLFSFSDETGSDHWLHVAHPPPPLPPPPPPPRTGTSAGTSASTNTSGNNNNKNNNSVGSSNNSSRTAAAAAATRRTKTTPFPLRHWELISDATPVMGENDTSLSLGLFGARRC